MLDGASRDARRTELYLDGLMAAEENGASEVPMDLDLDPAVLLAASELRAGLVRVHPSFRFEEGLAARLAGVAAGMNPAGSNAPGSNAPSRLRPPALLRIPGLPDPVAAEGAVPAVAQIGFDAAVEPHRLSMRSRPSRPLVVGSVGVASAALSIGAVYVAWRWSRSSQTPMVRAVRAARSGRVYSSGHGRRAGVLHGILGVMP